MFDILRTQFWSLTLSGIALGFIYVLISMGYTMVYGVLRMINFANSEIFLVGAFASLLVGRDVFHYTMDTIPPTGAKLALVLTCSLIASMLTSSLVAFLVELIAYRNLRNRTSNRIAPLITAIGMSIVISETVRIITKARAIFAPRILEKQTLFVFHGADIRLDSMITIFAGLILFIAL